MGFPQNILANTWLYTSTQLTTLKITFLRPMSFPAHIRRNLDSFFIASEVTAQRRRLIMPVTLWTIASRQSVTSFDAMQKT